MIQNHSDAPDKIAKWLEKQGYPLEMLVARHFQKADFYVRISDFYTDFETNKSREIDITAQHHSDINDPVLLQVSFHVECKSSPDKPWILFISDTSRSELGFRYENLISTALYRTFLALMILRSEHRENFYSRLNKCPLFLYQNICYGVTQAFTSGQDVPFTAIMSAVKSSVSRIKHFDSFFKIGDKKYHCAIAFPVVVFDGILYECKMGENGEINLEEVESSVIYWKFPNPTNSSPFVYIITKNSLSDFVKKASETAKMFVDLTSDFMPKLTELAEEWSQKNQAS